MAFGKLFSNLKGLFNGGPMKELAEELATEQAKQSAEEVVITDEFRQVFEVNTPVKENIRHSFMLSMLVMASHIIIADGKVEAEEYGFLGRFLRENFNDEMAEEGVSVVQKLITKREELEASKPNAFIQYIGDCALQIKETLSEDLRYQMLSMLALIVKSDSKIDDKEVEALREVALYIGMKASDVDTLMKIDVNKAKDDLRWLK